MTAAAPKPPTRFLVLTAGFGEGHNSAARNVATGLQQLGHTCEVFDPCAVASPKINRCLSRWYRIITTRLPQLWLWIYRRTDQIDFSKRQNPMMRKIERVLAAKIQQFNPDALISTYPLYPYTIEHLVEDGMPRLPHFTIVTDSIEINAAWCRATHTHFLVADPLTRNAMISQGCDPKTIFVTGFPVHTDFAQQQNQALNKLPDPFRVLFFATARKPDLAPSINAILNASHHIQITLVLGRNVRLLYREAKKLQNTHPNRIKLIGWTKRVPQLMLNHHLIVGKAGGATVHEALAACCPMLVHHLVPGQEEGNIALLQSLNVGGLADTPSLLRSKIQKLLAHQGQEWLQCQQRLINFQQQTQNSPSAAHLIAIQNSKL